MQVHELASIGGAHNYNFIKHVESLITNKLVTQCNWLGKKGKRIYAMEIVKLIIVASDMYMTDTDFALFIKELFYERFHEQRI